MRGRHLEILRKMKKEAEIFEKRAEERKKRLKAAGRFKEVVKAEKLYREWELEYYEIAMDDFLRAYGVKPVFKEVWHVAENCVDRWRCYRMLAFLKLERRVEDLELVKAVARLHVDLELFIELLYRGRREEAVKLIRL